MVFESHGAERKEIAIMRILDDSPAPIGARIIAHHLTEHGFELGERAVRYHLKLLDERGLTHLVGKRDGRILTEKGIAEVRSALVKDKVGFAISKIETLSFRTSFDSEKRLGLVPINISLFPKGKFEAALKAMKPAFAAGLCTSDLVAVVSEGKRLGEIIVPEGKIGFGTVCSIIFNGTLLKAGVPIDSRFGGILQMRNHNPVRFAELIDYSACSLDPSTIFIKARMTSVHHAVNSGEGEILANFREIPSICRPLVEKTIAGLGEAGFHGVIAMGRPSESVCEMPVGLHKIGMILLGGLNPVAAAEEAGYGAENLAMSTVIEYQELVRFHEAVNDYRDLVRFWQVAR